MGLTTAKASTPKARGVLKVSDGMVKSVNVDQTAPSGVVLSGFTLSDQVYLSK